MENENLLSSRGTWLLGGGVVLLVTGLRLGLINYFGTDQPFADQWGAEGTTFLQVPLHEPFNWGSFFWPHGEHRPAITRLITRGLILGNGGQWDCYAEIVANLIITAVFLGVAWQAAIRVGRGPWLVGVAGLMVLLFSQPCAYENLLWGFQSQFLFLFLAGWAHVYGTLRTSRINAIWWGGCLAGFCGLFSIAAGVMSAAALVAAAVGEFIRGRRDAWTYSTVIFNGLLLAFGLWLLPTGVASGETHLDHLATAVRQTAYLLSWPMGGAGWCLLLQAPCALLLASWIRSPRGDTNDRWLAILGLWVALMAFAVGFGRTLTPDTIGVRYYDIMIVGLFVQALALVHLLRSSNRLGGLRAGFALCWLIGAGTGFWNFNRPEFSGAMLRQQKIYALEQREIVREFMVNDDPAPLEEFENRTHRLPHFQLTLALLRDKQCQPLLPPSLSTTHRIGRLSRWALAVAGAWGWLAGAGALLLIAGSARARLIGGQTGARIQG